MAYKIKKSIIYFLLTALALLCMLPFLLMLINATRTGTDIASSFTFIPGKALKENWDIVMNSQYVNIFKAMFNSVIVAVPATLLTSYFSALTAYGLAIYKFRGRKVIFACIVIFMMIPGQLSLIGFYNLCQKLGMINTYWPLILPAIASPGTVFFLRQYILSVLPTTLLEAARIDGGKELHIFHKIVLPIMSPGIATMAIGAFIGNWNNYLMPLILLTSNDKFTLPLMISTIDSDPRIATSQGAVYLAVAISVIPIFIVFGFCSKHIIGSITAGSVKE